MADDQGRIIRVPSGTALAQQFSRLNASDRSVIVAGNSGNTYILISDSASRDVLEAIQSARGQAQSIATGSEQNIAPVTSGSDISSAGQVLSSGSLRPIESSTPSSTSGSVVQRSVAPLAAISNGQIENLDEELSLKEIVEIEQLAKIADSKHAYVEVVSLLQRVLPHRERLSGINSQETSKILGDLANRSMNLEKYGDAAIYYRRLVSIYEHRNEGDIYQAAIYRRCLVEMLSRQGRHAEAETLCYEVLSKYYPGKFDERTFGARHELLTLMLLVRVLRRQETKEKYNEAVKFQRQVVELSQKDPRAGYDEIHDRMGDLVLLLKKLGRLDEANALQREFPKPKYELFSSFNIYD